MSRSRAPILAIHLAGWGLFLALPLLFMQGFREEQSFWPMLASYDYWQFSVVFMGLFYLNAYGLFPRLYLRGHRVWYFLVVLALLGGIHLLKPFEQLMRTRSRKAGREWTRSAHGPGQDKLVYQPPFAPGGPGPFQEGSPELRQEGPGPGRRPPPGGRVDITSLFVFVMVMGLSTANRLGEQWRQVEQRAARAEADKAQAEAGKALAELSVLKAQIHPHFLFNTLNNLYSLAVTESQHTAPAILKLSNLMRYVTDEVNQDLVPLQHEIDCIRDYIDLQRLRLSQKTKVEVEIVGEVAGKKIAPLLLIPFVENVFKYGVSNHEPSVIVIRLRAEAQAIIFFCQNTIFPAPRPAERMGVGIANTRQRLVHLYPGRHTLEITQDSSLFTVQLTLEG